MITQSWVGQAIPGPWLTWTPSFANVTTTSGTTTAFYIQIGKTIHFSLNFVLGASSAVGTSPTFSLPVTAAARYTNNDYVLGTGQMLDSGTARFQLTAYSATTTTVSMFAAAAGGTHLTIGTGITATVPFTWTTNDAFSVTGTYEAA